jgi:site-specific DNA recombinase
MQGHWVKDAPYYRCQFPAEYALVNHVKHPLSVFLREAVVIGEVDDWLAREFAPHRLSETIHDLMAARQRGDTRARDHQEAV